MRMERAMLALQPFDPRCTVTVTGSMNRPPMVETPATLTLYERARRAAGDAGFTLPKQHRGGGSDGNFTAALGIPTLDGLGCPGAGAHAEPRAHPVASPGRPLRPAARTARNPLISRRPRWTATTTPPSCC